MQATERREETETFVTCAPEGHALRGSWWTNATGSGEGRVAPRASDRTDESLRTKKITKVLRPDDTRHVMWLVVGGHVSNIIMVASG